MSPPVFVFAALLAAAVEGKPGPQIIVDQSGNDDPTVKDLNLNRKNVIQAKASSSFLFQSPAIQHLIPAKSALSQTPSCNGTQLKSCIAAFSKAIGFRGKSFRDLLNYLGQYLADFKHQFAPFCSHIQKLETCLTPSTGCFSAANLEQELGLSPNDASGLEMLAKTYAYECRPSVEKVILAKYDCLQDISRTRRDELTECVAVYSDRSRKDPGHTCRYLQQFVQCYDRIYGACGEDAAAMTCGEFKAQYSVAMPNCQIMCPTIEAPTLK